MYSTNANDIGTYNLSFVATLSTDNSVTYSVPIQLDIIYDCSGLTLTLPTIGSQSIITQSISPIVLP